MDVFESGCNGLSVGSDFFEVGGIGQSHNQTIHGLKTNTILPRRPSSKSHKSPLYHFRKTKSGKDDVGVELHFQWST